MHEEISAAFAALNHVAKVDILARAIHMETVHVRAAHMDHPDDVMRIYASSEFMHRLSGFIMRILNGSVLSDEDAARMIRTVVSAIEPRGQYYVDKLHVWIDDALKQASADAYRAS